MRPRFRRAAIGLGAVVVALAVTMGIAACGGDITGAGTASASGTGAGAGQPPDAGPGGVAVAYLDAAMAADFTKASTYVVAGQRDVIKALGLSTGPGTLVKMTGQVTPGTVTQHGDEATVVFVGRMCRTEQAPSGGTQGPYCIDNDDPHSTNPAFTAHLTRVAGTRQVSLPTPTPSTG